MGLGDGLLRTRDFRTAESEFRAALAMRPDSENAWLGLGQCLLHTGKGREALEAFARVTGPIAESAILSAWRGTAHAHAGEDEAAAEHYAAALARDANCFDALFGLALIEERHGRLDEAARRYAQAWRLQPRSNLVLGNLVYCLRRMAAWDEMATPEAELIARLERGEVGDYATQWMGIDLRATTFRNIATQFIRAQTALHVAPVERTFAPRTGGRLRIGYVSADFRNHATSRLLVEVLEQHDRTRFEIFAYALKPGDDSTVGRRIAAACE
ncbi:MAG TPA: tetratricopeptide repeat protein, partial [Rudaea sp.]